jgi:hypothetical protein
MSKGHKAWKDGVGQTAKNSGHVPNHGGPQTGNGYSGDKSRKPTGVTFLGKVVKKLTGD